MPHALSGGRAGASSFHAAPRAADPIKPDAATTRAPVASAKDSMKDRPRAPAPVSQHHSSTAESGASALPIRDKSAARPSTAACVKAPEPKRISPGAPWATT
ncbi:MAG: hypothetical protein U1E21_10625 [Reyranellaceae bacterium]